MEHFASVVKATLHSRFLLFASCVTAFLLLNKKLDDDVSDMSVPKHERIMITLPSSGLRTYSTHLLYLLL